MDILIDKNLDQQINNLTKNSVDKEKQQIYKNENYKNKNKEFSLI